MASPIVRGAVAGALGTVAIDVATYSDMLARGRPPSELPGRAAAQLASRLHLPLGRGDHARNRADALGALSGYGAGMAIGALAGLVAGEREVPLLPLGLALGGVADLATAAPSVALGVTDPRRWSPEDWLAEVLPHLLYGAVTATALHVFERSTAARRPTRWAARWRRRTRASVPESGGAVVRRRATRAAHARRRRR